MQSYVGFIFMTEIIVKRHFMGLAFKAIFVELWGYFKTPSDYSYFYMNNLALYEKVKPFNMESLISNATFNDIKASSRLEIVGISFLQHLF